LAFPAARVMVGDLDVDSRPDIVLVNPNGGNVTVLLNTSR